jgi:hypothetical protein
MLAANAVGSAHSVMIRNLMRGMTALAFLAPLASVLPAQATNRPPSLVVLISIDQFRGAYLEKYASQYTGGLARLSRGAWFTNAHHDHAITETAPGHATLLAGRFPRSTGITMNRVGVDDPAAPLIAGGYGPGASPLRFQGTTLVDWIRAQQPQSRALSVSSKDRAAILPIGKSKSEVYWYSPDGRFVTSKYYRDTLPTWVLEWNARMLAEGYAGKSWTLMLPESAYSEPDSVPEEGRTNFLFPHVLPDDPMAAAGALRGTPFIDELILSFALDGVKSLALGRGPTTDVLSISLSATDYIGHRYGPDSREIHDQMLRVDRALGVFLDSLYKLRDSSQITIALSGDHGAGTIPELKKDITPLPTRVTYGTALPELREGLRKAKVDTNAIDIDVQIVEADRAEFKRAGVNADSVLTAFATAVRALPGVARVDRFRALLADTTTDPIARRWSHQFPSNAGIDLVITLTPYSLWGRGNVASHGSPYDYDSNVPLVFYGAGVKPGKHGEFVRTVDLAPTLAAIAGVKPTERLDGVPLTAAIKP